MGNDQFELWHEMCEVMKWHNRPRHCCVDTINRLLAKHPVTKGQRKTIRVTRESLVISAETRSIEQLWQLIHRKHLTRKPPGTTEVAVVVLRFGGNEYLLDGRRRINHWMRRNVAGPHRVLVLHARDMFY
ncbi:MAG: hypothetical protein ACREVI_12715 [Steroidobacteraceae bacterium]